MKIFILSDTHGETERAVEAIRREKPDQIIHLGDCLRDAEELERSIPYTPLCSVPGNNDWFFDAPKEKVISLGGIKIFLCHGHTTRVKYGLDLQVYRALQAGCAVSLFGHTHRPLLEEQREILLLNPGSAADTKTYAILTLTPGQKPFGEIKTL